MVKATSRNPPELNYQLGFFFVCNLKSCVFVSFVTPQNAINRWLSFEVWARQPYPIQTGKQSIILLLSYSSSFFVCVSVTHFPYTNSILLFSCYVVLCERTERKKKKKCLVSHLWELSALCHTIVRYSPPPFPFKSSSSLSFFFFFLLLYFTINHTKIHGFPNRDMTTEGLGNAYVDLLDEKEKERKKKREVMNGIRLGRKDKGIRKDYMHKRVLRISFNMAPARCVWCLGLFSC